MRKMQTQRLVILCPKILRKCLNHDNKTPERCCRLEENVNKFLNPLEILLSLGF